MQYAIAACIPRAQKKRKCDRLLPVCSRCSSIRTNELCRYKNLPQPIGPVVLVPSCPLVSDTRPLGCPGSNISSSVFRRGRPIIVRQPTKSKLACGQCRSQKRARDRALPACSRCESQSKQCVYTTIPVNRRTEQSPDLAQISTEVSRARVHLRTIYGPEIRTDYPIRDSKYIPSLLNHFCSILIIPAASALPNSLARHVQSTWMLSAMHGPCLFHSTLFAASAHLDGLLGIADNPRTIYHQLQAVTLLRERLSQPHFRVTYETIGAVLGLGYFDIVIGNGDGVQAHNQGLIQMLTTKHDQGPDTEALLGLANMTHFTRAMVSHTDALSLPNSSISRDKGVYPVNPLSGISPSCLLSRVLARAAAENDTPTSPVLTPDTILDLIGVAHLVTQQDAKPLHESPDTTATPTILTLGADALRHASLHPSFDNQIPMAEHMNKCVQLAAKICCNHLLLRKFRAPSSTSPPPPPPIGRRATTTTIMPVQSITPKAAIKPITTTSPITPIITTPIPTPSTSATRPHLLHDDISLLKATLPKVDFVSWLQYAPEAYVWVCFTAAAAAAYNKDEERGKDDNEDRTSFILTPMPVITATDSAELRLMREGWAYLRWLRGKGGELETME